MLTPEEEREIEELSARAVRVWLTAQVNDALLWEATRLLDAAVRLYCKTEGRPHRTCAANAVRSIAGMLRNLMPEKEASDAGE